MPVRAVTLLHQCLDVSIGVYSGVGDLRKYLSHFDEFESLLFVMDVSVYACGTLYYETDPSTHDPSSAVSVTLSDSGLESQMILLESVINDRASDLNTRVLLMNKCDLFERKIVGDGVPLTVCFL